MSKRTRSKRAGELAARQHLLTIAVRAKPPAGDLARRLNPWTPARHTFEVLREDVTLPIPQAFTDFEKQFLQNLEMDVRVYTGQGHSTPIVVPEQYARQLDEVRALRLATERGDGTGTIHPLANRVLPEDLLPYLDELPDSSFFSKIFLLDWANPRDVWLKVMYQNDAFVSAASVLPSGTADLYRAENSEFLRVNLFHEWTHLLKNRSEAAGQAFDSAVDMEWRIYVPSTYALRSYGEHWAVVGENLIQPDGAKFMEVADRAPVRTMVLMRALKAALAQVPVASRSVYHENFVARILWCEINVKPKADQMISQSIQRATQVREHLKMGSDSKKKKARRRRRRN